MRDKQLRAEFVKFKEDLVGLVWNSSTLNYDGSVLGKMKHQINEIEFNLSHEYELSTGWITSQSPRSILGRIIDLEKSNRQILDNQKLIIEYLGIEKVEEPPKTFYRKKNEKEKRGSKDCSCK